jgi:ParB family chromosome partitioning protein
VAVGVAETRPVRRRRPSDAAAPALTDVAERLTERFDTRVKVDLGRSKGRITIEFASMEDLERIVALMDAGGDGALSTSRGDDESTPTVVG